MRGDADPRAVASILRALELVESSLGESVGVEDMAGAAAYSLFHFSRLFAAGTGHSPYDYLMRRRVAVAAERAAESNASLTEIALDFGFDSPDGFARAFRRCFGLAPSEARRLGTYPRAVARTRIGADMIEFLLAAGPIVPVRVEAEETPLIGLPCEGEEAVQSARSLLGPGTLLVFTAPDGRAFAGRPSPLGAEALFPLCLTRLPQGQRARFVVAREGRGTVGKDLGLLRDFAHRAWLPGAGYAAPPAGEVVEYGADGAIALDVILPR
ncbi:MAG: AraC family transcriptional regulator [Spirochaetaceae bacterium]|nr:AraC family transcriptional regulator [Spirochaetaceae bacterium]